MYKTWRNCISATVLVNIEVYTWSKRFHFKLKNVLNNYEKTLEIGKGLQKNFLTNKKNPEHI